MGALAGLWRGKGHGRYPTIEPFDYQEEVSLVRLPGKPILAYTQRTRSAQGDPLHAETGYYRFGAEEVELVIAQPTGVAETHRGTFSGTRIEFEPAGLITTPSAVEVKEVRRLIDLEGDRLRYRLEMSAVGQPLLLHLEAELDRVAEADGT